MYLLPALVCLPPCQYLDRSSRTE